MKDNRWAGRPAAIIASGPSLTIDDIDLVRQAKIKTIAVNSSWKVAPFCDVLYAGDSVWWNSCGSEVDIPAERWTCSRTAAHLFKANYRDRQIKLGYNSGMLAVELALYFGASPAIMLGFDCSVKNGLHHHGKHENTANPNSKKCLLWLEQWRKLIKRCKGERIVNCSRYTEIDCIPQRPLEDVLCELG